MIVRQDFSILPPKAFLQLILDTLGKVYLFLWDKKDKLNTVSMTWEELTKYYNRNSFRTSLRKLNNEGLLSYSESVDGVSIELVGWDEIEVGWDEIEEGE